MSTKSTFKDFFKIWGPVALLCIIIMVASYFLFVEEPPPKKIVMAGGNPTSTYYSFAQKYREQLKKTGIELEITSTAGSIENLQKLQDENSGVSLALVQSGIAP